MGGIFGKKTKTKTEMNKVTDHDLAVLELKKMRDRLRQYQRRIESQLQKERLVAKQLLKDGKKQKALLLLKKKKYMEQCLDKSDQQIDNLEKMTHELEFSQIQVKLMEGMKTGNAALKKIHEVMSIEEVERILDETQDAVEYQREIDSLLATTTFSQQDEDELDKELQEITKEALPDVPVDEISLPDVPKDKISEPSPAREQGERQPVLAS